MSHSFQPEEPVGILKVVCKQIVKRITYVPVKLKKRESNSLEKRFEFGAIPIWACGFSCNGLFGLRDQWFDGGNLV